MVCETFLKNYRCTASVSDVGTARENNEDSILVMDGAGCYAVSDGMGGGSAGEIASSTVVTYIRNALNGQLLPPQCRRELFSTAVYSAHDAILKYARKHEYETMGATLVALLLDPWMPNRADIYFAGDSRIYRIRGGRLKCLSADHTVSQAFGIPEKDLPVYMSGVLSNAVGIQSGFFLASESIDIRKNDILLLCSDGLYRQISEDSMASALTKKCDLDAVLAGWVQQANAEKGLDNLSAVVIRFSELPPQYDPDPEEKRLNDTPDISVKIAQEENAGDTII